MENMADSEKATTFYDALTASGMLFAITFLSIGFVAGWPLGFDVEAAWLALEPILENGGRLAAFVATLTLLSLVAAKTSRRAGRFLLSLAGILALFPTAVPITTIEASSEWAPAFLVMGHYLFIAVCAQAYSSRAIPNQGQISLLRPLSAPLSSSIAE